MSYIEFKDVVKEYKMGEVSIKALNNTNFSINCNVWSRTACGSGY